MLPRTPEARQDLSVGYSRDGYRSRSFNFALQIVRAGNSYPGTSGSPWPRPWTWGLTQMSGELASGCLTANHLLSVCSYIHFSIPLSFSFWSIPPILLYLLASTSTPPSIFPQLLRNFHLRYYHSSFSDFYSRNVLLKDYAAHVVNNRTTFCLQEKLS